jgi:hypothetical protein
MEEVEIASEKDSDFFYIIDGSSTGISLLYYLRLTNLRRWNWIANAADVDAGQPFHELAFSYVQSIEA